MKELLSKDRANERMARIADEEEEERARMRRISQLGERPRSVACGNEGCRSRAVAVPARAVYGGDAVVCDGCGGEFSGSWVALSNPIGQVTEAAFQGF